MRYRYAEPPAGPLSRHPRLFFPYVLRCPLRLRAGKFNGSVVTGYREQPNHCPLWLCRETTNRPPAKTQEVLRKKRRSAQFAAIRCIAQIEYGEYRWHIQE